MAKQKKKRSRKKAYQSKTVETIVFATAIISLITTIINFLKAIM